MYPRNATSPQRIAIGPVISTSDGSVQTSGVTVRVLPQGGTESDGLGTVGYSSDGVVLYTPTQAETNYPSFILIATKTGCFPASITIVTYADSMIASAVWSASRSGYNASGSFGAVLEWSNPYSITAQEVRNALLLSPSGQSQNNSIDFYLSNILLDTSSDLPSLISGRSLLSHEYATANQVSSMYCGVSAVVQSVVDSGDFTLSGDSLSEADEAYRNMWLLFLSGDNRGVSRVIGSYDGTAKRIRFTGKGVRGPFPSTVRIEDSCVVVGGVV